MIEYLDINALKCVHDVSPGAIYAFSYKTLPILSFLLMIGVANTDEEICCATYRGHEPAVRFIVHRGANVNTGNGTPLRNASLYGYERIVKFLIDNGAKVNIPHDNVLAYAAEGGNESIVRLLVDAGAKVYDELDEALYAAAKWGHGPIVAFLISRGAWHHKAAKVARKNYREDIFDFIRFNS